MDVEFLETKIRTDQVSYVDLVRIDGQLYTFLMRKAEEPNLYHTEKYEKGDHMEAYLQ